MLGTWCCPVPMHTPPVPTGPPRNPRAVGASPNSIAVAWDTVDPFKRNGDIIMYQVLYLPLPSASGMTAVNPEMVERMVEAVLVETAERMVFLRDLTEFTQYVIFVRALNANGGGSYAEKVIALTLAEPGGSTTEVQLNVPTGPPRDLVAVGMVAGIAMTWNGVSVDQRNGVLTAYEISYQTQLGQNMTVTFELMNTTDLFVCLMNLEEDVVYEVSVRAYNGDGPGPYSEITTATTLKDDIPSGQVNSTLEIPSGTPLNVVVKSVTLTTLSLEWDKVNNSTSPHNYSEVVTYEPLSCSYRGECAWNCGYSQPEHAAGRFD